MAAQRISQGRLILSRSEGPLGLLRPRVDSDSRPFRFPLASSNPDSVSVRLDKWLWCVRLFKTRSLATDACRTGSVTVNGHPAKPARDLRLGERVEWKHGLVLRSVEVRDFPLRRIAARDVQRFYEDLTAPQEWAKAKEKGLQQWLAREKGSGRPTKRDRRRIDKLLG